MPLTCTSGKDVLDLVHAALLFPLGIAAFPTAMPSCSQILALSPPPTTSQLSVNVLMGEAYSRAIRTSFSRLVTVCSLSEGGSIC